MAATGGRTGELRWCSIDSGSAGLQLQHRARQHRLAAMAAGVAAGGHSGMRHDGPSAGLQVRRWQPRGRRCGCGVVAPAAARHLHMGNLPVSLAEAPSPPCPRPGGDISLLYVRSPATSRANPPPGTGTVPLSLSLSLDSATRAANPDLRRRRMYRGRHVGRWRLTSTLVGAPSGDAMAAAAGRENGHACSPRQRHAHGQHSS